MKQGKIDISQLNALPEKHEFETAKYFSALGKDVKFIRPSSMPGVRRPDILMDGIEWEIKCPQGKSDRTIENNFRKAVQQSKYLIFDLRWINIPEKQALSQIKRLYEGRKYLKKMLIIKKNKELITLD